MASDIVKEVLQSMGVAGAIITVLMSAVGALSTAIILMYRKANDVNAARLKERDLLTSTLIDSNNTMRGMLEAMQERNDVTDQLAQAISNQSSQAHLSSERVKMQYDVMREDHARMAVVVGSLAEAVRTISQTTVETRNALPHIGGEVRTIIAANLASFLQDVRSIVQRIGQDVSDEIRRNRQWPGD